MYTRKYFPLAQALFSMGEMVGVVGIEPTWSWPQTKRSATDPHSDIEKRLALPLGFEPRFAELEAAVLPGYTTGAWRVTSWRPESVEMIRAKW